MDVRYFGQGFDIPLDIDPAWLDDPDGALAAIAGQFDAEHERLFSFVLGSRPRAGQRPGLGQRAAAPRWRPPRWSPAPGTRPRPGPVTPGSTWTAAGRTRPVYDRAELRAGDVIDGPAIVTEMDSTTLILPGHAATVDPCGSLLIRPARPKES